jgi:hypothetical protein
MIIERRGYAKKPFVVDDNLHLNGEDPITMGDDGGVYHISELLRGGPFPQNINGIDLDRLNQVRKDIMEGNIECDKKHCPERDRIHYCLIKTFKECPYYRD